MLYIYLLFLITTIITFLISGIKYSLFTVIVLILSSWRPIKKYFQFIRFREVYILTNMKSILEKKNDSEQLIIMNRLGTFTFNRKPDYKKKHKKKHKK
tara:strand:- start:207 stop:500 length:294 start_codon:yes stop_codon:yes gene_type:complete